MFINLRYSIVDQQLSISVKVVYEKYTYYPVYVPKLKKFNLL